jgi:hypothetical protein
MTKLKSAPTSGGILRERGTNNPKQFDQWVVERYVALWSCNRYHVKRLTLLFRPPLSVHGIRTALK